MRHAPILAGISLALAVGAAQAAEAQGFGDRLKKRAEDAAKRKVEQRVEQRAGEATDKALSTAENAVKCAATDQKCIDQAKSSGKNVVLTDDKGNVAGGSGGAGAAAAPASPAASLKPGEGAWANYDFKPGERTVFFEDFTKDEVGDFPRRFELISGNLEVVDWQGGRYLHAKDGNAGVFYIPLPEVLPERFTVEFDYAGPSGNSLYLTFVEPLGDHNQVWFGVRGAGVWRGSAQSEGKLEQDMTDKFYRARVMVDGRYVKVYVNEQRVANLPNANLGRSNKIRVELPWNGTKLLTNIRIAAGGKKLYDALAEKGRVATQGIYFDTGSDRIRPESSPTLKEIGQMLKEHSDLQLTIEGHTDNVGGAAANQKLSEMRAEAVKQFLVSEYGIEETRLTAKGLGATKPVASNDTPEGRQNNRRVELVKG